MTNGNLSSLRAELAELTYVAGDSWPHSDSGAEILGASQALERRSGRS